MAFTSSQSARRRGASASLGLLAALLLPMTGLRAVDQSDAPSVFTIVPARAGNVFAAGETVEVPVQAAGKTLQWVATDFWGREVARGAEDFASGKTTVRFSPPGTGYYDIALEMPKDGGGVATGRTRVAVVPGCDLAKVADSPFGVMTHFSASWEPDLIPVLAAAGIKNVRDEIFWAAIEQKPGVFAFPEKFEKYRAELDRHHMKALTPLTFGNRLYDDAPNGPSYGIAPFSDKGIAAYARYADEVLKHYGRAIDAVEVWNEYNGAFGRGPADGKASAYAKMLIPAYDAVKAQRPDVLVLGCSTIGNPIGWIEEVFRHGGADHMDGVSIHPYGYLFQPEMHVEGLEALRALIRKYNGGKDKPIWATEQGYYLTKPGAQGNREPITEEVKARYLVRVYTVFLAHGVDKTFWYLARNDDAFGTMGLVGKPDDPAGRYAPLPAYSTYAELIRQLTGAVYGGQDDAPEGVYGFRFRRGGDEVRVMWSLRPATVALRSAGAIEVTDLMGQAVTVTPVNGAVHVGLSDAPVYVKGRISGIAAQHEIELEVPAEVAAGETAPVTVRLPEGRKGELEADGKSWPVIGGSLVELTAASAAGERWIPYVLKMDGRVVDAGAWKIMVRPAVVLDRYPRLVAPDVLRVKLQNFSREKSAEIETVSWEMSGTKQTRASGQTLAPQQSLDVDLPVPAVKPFVLNDVGVSVRLKGGEELSGQATVSHNPVPYRTIAVDGDLSDWKGVDGLDLAQAVYKKLEAERMGDEDLSGRVFLSWDEQNLYLAARIRDDVFHQEHEGYSTWKGDGLQIGLTASMPWQGGEWAGPVQEFGLALTQKGPEFYRTGGSGETNRLPQVPLVVKREGDTTIYECAIPWREIPGLGTEAEAFSFGVFVNDNDGQGRKGYLQWADIKELNKMQPFFRQKPDKR